MQRRTPSPRQAVTRRAIVATAAVMAAAPRSQKSAGSVRRRTTGRRCSGLRPGRARSSYDQVSYEPLIAQVSQRLASNSEAARARIGVPRRAAYGPSDVEKLDLYRTSQPRAPVFVYMHGGTWRWGAAKDAGFPAEMFVNAGAHYVALDFVGVQAVGGDLGVLVAQVRRAIAWIYKNAESFGGDPERIYVGGHSSGGHLCGPDS